MVSVQNLKAKLYKETKFNFNFNTVSYNNFVKNMLTIKFN